MNGTMHEIATKCSGVHALAVMGVVIVEYRLQSGKLASKTKLVHIG